MSSMAKDVGKIMNMPNVLRTVNPTIVPSQKQFTSIFKVFREPQPRSQGQQDYSRAVPAATAARTRVPLHPSPISARQWLPHPLRCSSAFKAAPPILIAVLACRRGSRTSSRLRSSPPRRMITSVSSLASSRTRSGSTSAARCRMWRPELVKQWYSCFGVKFDLPTAGLGTDDGQPHPRCGRDKLRDTQGAMHDICHRVVQLRDDLGMSEHFKAVIDAGFNVIDPLPLLAERLVRQKRFRSAPGLQIQ